MKSETMLGITLLYFSLGGITRRQLFGYSSAAVSYYLPMKDTKTMTSVYIATSLDGYIATLDGSVDFLDQFQTSASAEDGDMGFSEFMSSVDLLIMGHNTFDKVISFGDDVWPYGDKQVWVWSRHPSLVKIPQIRANNVVALSAAPHELLKMAKQKGYLHAYVDGGSTIQQFLQQDCIDDLILTTAPLLLGEGIPLFKQAPKLSLEYVSTRSFSTGLVQSHYRVKHQSHR